VRRSRRRGRRRSGGRRKSTSPPTTTLIISIGRDELPAGRWRRKQKEVAGRETTGHARTSEGPSSVLQMLCVCCGWCGWAIEDMLRFVEQGAWAAKGEGSKVETAPPGDAMRATSLTLPPRQVKGKRRKQHTARSEAYGRLQQWFKQDDWGMRCVIVLSFFVFRPTQPSHTHALPPPLLAFLCPWSLQAPFHTPRPPLSSPPSSGRSRRRVLLWQQFFFPCCRGRGSAFCSC